MINGWINYYGKYTRSAMDSVLQRINGTLALWSIKKYKSLRNKKLCAIKRMEEFASKNTCLFAHWRFGITGVYI